MPDYYGNPIPGVDTVYDYYGPIVAPTAARAIAQALFCASMAGLALCVLKK